MAVLGDDNWRFSYTSPLLDYIINDDTEDKRPSIRIPQRTTEDLLDFLANEDLNTKTPTSVTFKSIEDPLPSYDEHFPTLTEQKTVTNESPLVCHRPATTLPPTFHRPVPHRPATSLAPTRDTRSGYTTPFSPSDVLNKIKQEPREQMDTDPIFNLETLRVSLIKEPTMKKEAREAEARDISEMFRKENSMSISLDDVSSMLDTSAMFDTISPVSPASSEGSTDTHISSSSVSDVESSPRRKTGAMKKTRRRKVTEGGSCPHLWQFILELLGDKTHAAVISWTGVEFHFKVHNSRELARLWGARKNKPRMNFDKLSRAMRYYYDKNIIRHISGQRLVYEFCRNNDDAVYTKLLKEAARTMPQKPLLPSTKVPDTAPRPPKYTPSSTTYPSLAALYNPSLYSSTEQYLSHDFTSEVDRFHLPHPVNSEVLMTSPETVLMTSPPPYIPNYSYMGAGPGAGYKAGPGTAGFKAEPVGYGTYTTETRYEYQHYTPY